MSASGATPAGALALLTLSLLTACSTTRQTAPPKPEVPQPAEAPQPTEVPWAGPAPAAPEALDAPMQAPPPPSQPHSAAAGMPPPCVCGEPAPKLRRQHKHTYRKREPAKRSAPRSVGPVTAPAANTVVDAEVKRIEGPLTAILGKNVYSPRGEDLGRVVDLLADPEGRVRVAIIDFGGFLGVGTRRIAVDWPLLHFSPSDKQKPLVLPVTREKLQSAPEYKDSTSPRVLMPPAAASDAAGAGNPK